MSNISNTQSSSPEGILFTLIHLDYNHFLFFILGNKRPKNDTDSGSEFLNQFLGFVNKEVSPGPKMTETISKPPKLVSMEKRLSKRKPPSEEDSNMEELNKIKSNIKREVTGHLLKEKTLKQTNKPSAGTSSESEEDYDSDDETSYDDDFDLKSDSPNDDGKQFTCFILYISALLQLVYKMY